MREVRPRFPGLLTLRPGSDRLRTFIRQVQKLVLIGKSLSDGLPLHPEIAARIRHVSKTPSEDAGNDSTTLFQEKVRDGESNGVGPGT
jgi:hypothetical protein